MADVIARLRERMVELQTRVSMIGDDGSKEAKRYDEGTVSLLLDFLSDEAATLLSIAEAARAFSEAVKACDPWLQTAATIMHTRGFKYDGPTFGSEHEALRAALARLEGR